MSVRQASGEVRLAGLAFRALGLLNLLAFLAVAGCSYHHNRDATSRAPSKAPGKAVARAGIHHVVKKGENLYRIGKAYGIDYATLARINRIADARDIRIGRRLFIPGATRTLPVQIITPIKEPVARSAVRARKTPSVVAPRKTPARSTAAAVNTPRGTKAAPRKGVTAGKKSRTPAAARKARVAKNRVGRPPPARRSKQGFVWPVRGKITARFDSRHDTLNDGIDIAAPSGTPVLATAAGQVIYSDHLRGYGNLIIVRHHGGFASVYAHNRRNLVRPGQKVARRQVIAEVGDTGRVTSPHLHFEIRRNNVARNPLSYLP